MRDRKKGGFLLAAGVIFVAVSVFSEGQLLCEYSAFGWGIAWGSNRCFCG